MRWHQSFRWTTWTRCGLALGLGLGLLSACNPEGDDAAGAADDVAVSEAVPGDGSDLSATKSEDAPPADSSEADAADDETAEYPAGAEVAADPQAEASGAVRVEFEPGSEGGMISGELEGGGDVDRYVLRATAGQILQLRVRGVSNGSVEIGLAGSEGAAMGSSGAQASGERNQLEMQLPATDDYTVSITASDAAPRLSYDLEIRIGGEPSEDAAEGAGGADLSGGDADSGASDAEPETIAFAPGEDSARIEGDLKGGEIDRYRLRASAGQELILSVQSDAAPALTVTDPAGDAVEPIRVGRVGPVFALEQAGLYVVGIQHASGGDPIDYSLQITIVEGQAGDAADAAGGTGSGASGGADATGAREAADASAATQLFFRSGADSTTVQGLLGGGGRADYRLTAAGGQRMQVSLRSDGRADFFQVVVADAAGKLLASGLDDAGTVELALPERQDYRISVIAQPQGAEESYSLTIAIR